MKRNIIILATIALLAASCADKPLDSTDSGRRITFLTGYYSPQTKAAFTDNTFNVTAWTASGLQYFSDITATKGSDGVWSTSEAYRWPKVEGLKFFATHGRKPGDDTKPWASVNAACTALTTGSTDITVTPSVASDLSALLLYTDKTAEYDYDDGDVPIIFKNALTAIKANVINRQSDDAIKQDASGKYREYDVYTGAEAAGKTEYYVIPFGFSPNGILPPARIPGYPSEQYPIKVKLKKPITHIWIIVGKAIEARDVANTGKLDMTMGSGGAWTKPTNEVWTVPATAAAHSSTVYMYNATAAGDTDGTPIPANLSDFECPLTNEYLVMPQDLNWSPSSTINNQKAIVNMTIQAYCKDTNEDGIFDYRDVFMYWVCTRDGSGNVVDSTLVSDATTAKNYKTSEFYKWYEWDGYAHTDPVIAKSAILSNVHNQYELLKTVPGNSDYPSVTFSHVLRNLTPHLQYPLEHTIDLAKLPGASNYWKMNTRVTYNIKFNPVSAELLFSPVVTDWTNLDDAFAN